MANVHHTQPTLRNSMSDLIWQETKITNNMKAHIHKPLQYGEEMSGGREGREANFHRGKYVPRREFLQKL